MPDVNDIHSRLNATRVAAIAKPASLADLSEAVVAAARAGHALCVAGGRHAMGGQQFATDAVLLDMNGLDRVIDFDPLAGHIEVEAGMQWPALIDWLWAHQADVPVPWGITQKQTGADRLSIGGAVAANVHGRGLRLRPFIQDVESLTLVDAQGRLRRCSRASEPELFRLAVGGYGLLGAIATVRLRLTRRRKVERLVEIATIDGLIAGFERRMAEGCLYGDFQFMTDPDSPLFISSGVFSCYRPVDDATPMQADGMELSEADWRRLYALAHTDRSRLYEVYAGFYQSTHGQVYWSDRHQLSVYIDGYHEEVDRVLGATVPASEMISEIYVPRSALAAFCAAVREDFRQHGTRLIYGTIRLIERDDESFLAWARQDFACIIFNLCVHHDAAGKASAAEAFRRLIDRAIQFDGSYYLTYHRWASREQVMRCHPALPEFLRLKRVHDPDERFQSDWYRHHRAMFPG